ncbi:hypothetical protein WP39_09270 [Streptomyces sp. 604F]|nr:hypothetical protein [Streptomyces sp. 604F]
MVGEPDQTGIVGRCWAEEQRSGVLVGGVALQEGGEGRQEHFGGVGVRCRDTVTSARRAREARSSRAAAWSRASARW